MGIPTDRVFPQALLDSFEHDPGGIAFEHGSREVTRGELLDLVGRFAAGLRSAGLGPGKGLAVGTSVTPEGFAVLLAAYAVGCRVVGVRPGLTPAQLPHVVGDVDALVVDDVVGTPGLVAAAGPATVLRIGPELLGAPEKPVAQGNPDDVAVVTFTSGSTGTPKGVALTYAAMSAKWWHLPIVDPRAKRLSEGYSRFLLFGTLTSVVMQEHLHVCLLSGGTAVIPGGLPVFPRVIAELRATACLLTVARLHHVLDVLRAEEVDLSSLRVMIVSGSPVAPHRMAEAFQRIGPAVRQGYGQTEIGLITMLVAEDVVTWPGAIGSVGLPWAGIELEVRDDEGNPLPTGRIGEIWVRTAYALKGYWNDEEQTADLLRDGWVRTRDVGHLDERGFLHLTGRARDVIIVNAIVHYAGPIEQALASHPDVDQAYVVGAPDERTGEAAHAFVVRAGERDPDLEDLRALVTTALGEAAVPATITVVAGVPVAPSGKPDKRALLAALPTGVFLSGSGRRAPGR
ncbi:MAG: fatty acid--CoA ligase family protein [Umezawaea sp.]